MNRITSNLLAILATGMLAATGVAPTRGTAPGGKPAADAPRPPAGSLFEMRIVADTKHTPDAAKKPGYRRVKVDPRYDESLDGLVAQVDDARARFVWVRIDPQNLNERDLLEVRKAEDERGQPAISFKLTPGGARRFAALTRSHLPEEQGMFRYHLAIIVEGLVVAMPVINTEIRDTGLIQFARAPRRPEEIDRLAKRLADAAASNAQPLKTRAVADQAAAIREAKAVDLPALAAADRVTVETAASGAALTLADPKAVDQLRRALRPSEAPPSAGLVAATLSFYRGDELIRKVWVYQGGEWGFERPGTSWTTGSDAGLWRLVEPRLSK